MMKNICVSAAALASTASAWSHPGHGMPGEVHWHATDVAGLAVVLAGALIAWWLARDE
jgi:hypothetical protein